jgi:tRNA-specific 2-thiouridylase
MGAPADGKPRYVLDIEPVARTVTVGSADGLDINEITADRSVCSAALRWSRDCLAQLRAHGDVHPCAAWLERQRAAKPPMLSWVPAAPAA